jgi:hypothetical protein
MRFLAKQVHLGNALVLTIIGAMAAIPGLPGTCNKYGTWVEVEGTLKFVTYCKGLCPSEVYSCSLEIEWLAGGGWIESCWCVNEETGEFDEPPCQGEVFWSSATGQFPIACDDACGPQWSLACDHPPLGWPVSPGEAPICECPQ